MKLFTFFLACLIGLFSLCAPAQAERHADMFNDQHWASYGRPWVPSDARRRAEMFAPVPLLLNENADLFDGVKPTPFATNDDMFAGSERRKLFYTARIFTNDDWTN
jgi:hypothetical protein